MGEIKSTLEIIMEKTKGMSMSEDEKREFKRRELQGKVGGLIQKLIDGFINIEGFRSEMAVLGKDRQDLLLQSVMEEAISRIALSEDNTVIMKVFEVTDGIDYSRIEEILEGVNQELADIRRESEKAMRLRLEEKGISGSAVIPNPDADPDWIDYVSKKDTELKTALRNVIPSRPLSVSP